MRMRLTNTPAVGFLAALLMALIAVSCSGDSTSATENRAFSMGFSPWLYDATVEAQDWVYGKLASEGDIISHHMEEGVPWPESYAGSAFSTSYQNFKPPTWGFLPGKGSIK